MRALLLVPVFLLSACGGDGSTSVEDPEPTSIIRDIRCEADVRAGAPYGGHFRGEIELGDSGRKAFATALLTEDGYFRMHIEDSLGDGAPEYQFIGLYRARGTRDNNPWAWGEYRAQYCSDAEPFCVSSEAQFELESLCAGELKGSLVAYPEGRPLRAEYGSLAFTLRVPVVSAYDTPATLAFAAGSYQASSALGAGPTDVVMTVDSMGAMFFQSAATGCVGNGSLTPHVDDRFNVYDVEIVIANCMGEFSNLNAGYTGLITRLFNTDSAFPVDGLLMWLSTPRRVGEQGADPAMTISAHRL